MEWRGGKSLLQVVLLKNKPEPPFCEVVAQQGATLLRRRELSCSLPPLCCGTPETAPAPPLLGEKLAAEGSCARTRH